MKISVMGQGSKLQFLQFHRVFFSFGCPRIGVVHRFLDALKKRSAELQTTIDWLLCRAHLEGSRALQDIVVG